MLEGGIHDHDDVGIGVLVEVGDDSLIELREAREGATFGG